MGGSEFGSLERVGNLAVSGVLKPFSGFDGEEGWCVLGSGGKDGSREGWREKRAVGRE